MSAQGSRLTAALTGRGREVGPVEAHERTVIAVTGKIHRKRARLRAILAEAKRLRRELRHDRRELRALLQRDSSVTEEQLAVAGRADGADRAIALAEARPREVAPGADLPESPARDAALDRWRQS